jgi:hypothetical protein
MIQRSMCFEIVAFGDGHKLRRQQLLTCSSSMRTAHQAMPDPRLSLQSAAASSGTGFHERRFDVRSRFIGRLEFRVHRPVIDDAERLPPIALCVATRGDRIRN